MGQRSNPIVLRLGIIRASDARWFASNENDYAQKILQDEQIRSYLNKKFKNAGIARIIIARSSHVDITLYVAFVGVIIGKKGAVIDELKIYLDKKYDIDVRINVKEVRKPDTEAQIVADSIATKMEQRSGGFKIHIKRAIKAAMDQGALGIKVLCGGRLGGAEIARSEEFVEGSVPLQNFRANISYGEATAHTTAGTCGVKVWIFNGMIRKKYNPFEGLQDKVSRSAISEQDRIEDYKETVSNNRS